MIFCYNYNNLVYKIKFNKQSYVIICVWIFTFFLSLMTIESDNLAEMSILYFGTNFLLEPKINGIYLLIWLDFE